MNIVRKKSEKNPKKDKNNKTQNDLQNTLNILSTNAASLKHKEEDLKRKVSYFKSGIFSIQETQFRRKGCFKMDQYIIFEAIRKGKQGGGSMLGVHVGLEPVLVRECNDTFEMITVEVKVGNRKLRIITGYGPQENWNEEEKMPFFTALEEEIAAAEFEGKEVIITMDANSKLGPEYIEGDPHPMSGNGKLLEQILIRHALVVVNGLKDKRKGVITRQKTTENGIEKSVIDMVLTSSKLAEHIEAIHIDEERQNVLRKNMKVGGVTRTTESDHNIIITTLNVTWCKRKNPVMEMFNYKNTEAQKKFKEVTTKTDELTKIVNMNKPIEVITNKFIKRLKGFVHECFKKVKIVDKPDEKLEDMYHKRRVLRNKTDEKSKEELENLDEKLAEMYSEKMVKTILSEVKGMSKSEEGGVNTGKLWKLKKKLMPRNHEPPTAMINKDGELLTDKGDIIDEAVSHYKNVFKEKEIDPEYKDYQKEREELCKKRLQETKLNKTKEWTVAEVTNVLKNLKTGKSKDPYDIPNELLKPNVAGDNLIEAITMLMNKLKNDLIVPDNINVCNVTNLYKNKGERTHYDSYRGIFRTTVLRNILEKLLHNDEYKGIDNNLTDCNVGSRKGRNVRDNLFVINAVMNEHKKRASGSLDINVYDVAKCFDSLWLSECTNDLYDAGLKNDKLNLLYEANKTASIAIKTSSGVSDRFTIQNTVMQGTVWGGLLCTTTMDQLCQNIYKDSNLLYKYRDSVDVPPLQMVDDIITASKCGATSKALNNTVNEFIATKKLKLSEKKCAKIHVGSKKSKENCQEHRVKDKTMKDSVKEKYLGDYVTNAANAKETIKERKKKGYGILAEISAILRDIPLGNKRIRVGLELRHAMFLNGILFNSETWIGFHKKDIQMLEVLDHKILRTITGAHTKVPLEMLYLETGQLDLKSVMSVRRLSYWHNILRRHEGELLSKVYQAMRDKPVKGDWIELLEADLVKIEMTIEHEVLVKQTKKEHFKDLVKERMMKHMFKEMEKAKSKHNKVKEVVHKITGKPETYLTTDKITSKASSLLFNLRSKCAKGFKENFKALYPDNLCTLCKDHIDSQELALSCVKVTQTLNVGEQKYEDLFGSLEAQIEITKLFQKVIKLRENQEEPGLTADRGTNTGPSVASTCY